MTYINEKELDPISRWEARTKPIGATFDAWPASATTTIVAINRIRVDRELPLKDIKTLATIQGNELTVKGIFLAPTGNPLVDVDPVVAGKYRIQCQVTRSTPDDAEECNLMIEVV